MNAVYGFLILCCVLLYLYKEWRAWHLSRSSIKGIPLFDMTQPLWNNRTDSTTRLLDKALIVVAAVTFLSYIFLKLLEVLGWVQLELEFIFFIIIPIMLVRGNNRVIFHLNDQGLQPVACKSGDCHIDWKLIQQISITKYGSSRKLSKIELEADGTKVLCFFENRHMETWITRIRSRDIDVEMPQS